MTSSALGSNIALDDHKRKEINLLTRPPLQKNRQVRYMSCWLECWHRSEKEVSLPCQLLLPMWWRSARCVKRSSMLQAVRRREERSSKLAQLWSLTCDQMLVRGFPLFSLRFGSERKFSTGPQAFILVGAQWDEGVKPDRVHTRHEQQIWWYERCAGVKGDARVTSTGSGLHRHTFLQINSDTKLFLKYHTCRFVVFPNRKGVYNYFKQLSNVLVSTFACIRPRPHKHIFLRPLV